MNTQKFARLQEDRYLTEWRKKMRVFAKGALYGRVRSVISTSDVLQESLLQVWQNAEFLESTTDRHAHSWVYRVVSGNVAKVWRYFGAKKRSVHSEQRDVDVSYDPMTPVDDLANKEELGRLVLAMESLPLTQQVILCRVIFEDQSFAQVSEEMGLTASKVRRIYHAAVEYLQSLCSNSND